MAAEWIYSDLSLPLLRGVALDRYLYLQPFFPIFYSIGYFCIGYLFTAYGRAEQESLDASVN